MSIVEIKVPDIGGHENVDIIAVEVKAGDTIALDDTLITLETDKATMDVPLPHLLRPLPRLLLPMFR